jgi:hypothetical protein
MHAFRLIVPLLLTLLFANAAYFAEAGQNAHRMMLYPEWSLLYRLGLSGHGFATQAASFMVAA